MRRGRSNFDRKLKLLLVLFVLFLVIKSLIWGKMGLIHYYQMQKELKQQEKSFDKLQKKTNMIKKEIDLLEQNDFLVERVARQDLQMARSDEKMYIIGKK